MNIWLVEGVILGLGFAPMYVPLIWARIGPKQPLALLAIEMLDAGVGWDRSYYSMSHVTGLSVGDTGEVHLNGENASLSYPSKKAVQRAYRRFAERERVAKLEAAARQFAASTDVYTRKVTPIRRKA